MLPSRCPRPSPPPAKSRAFNSEIVVEPHAADLVPDNVADLLGDVHLILDGTDNFETRYLINDYAVSEKLPWIYAAGVGSYAVTMTVLPGETACLACIFPDSPKGMVETCDTSGILNSAVNLVASIAATEAMKLIVGARDKIRRTLLVVRRVVERARARSRPRARATVAAPASSTTSSTSPEKAVHPSPCADATRCRSTSASAPSTSRKSPAASPRTVR